MDLPALLRTIGMILLVILVFNLMIVVHELGHFWAARWRGLRIDRFQIWFGRPIWKKRIKGVQWGMGWLPLGGFVALPQMAPMEAIEGANTERRELPPISPLDKIIVAFSGPLASFLLALVFAVVVMLIGKPSAEGGDNRVGAVLPDSAAQKAGILPGDRIIEIDGEPVEFFAGPWRSIQERVTLSTSQELPVVVERPGAGRVALTVQLESKPKRWWQRSQPRTMGVYAFVEPRIDAVMDHSPAAVEGLRIGDTVLAVDGRSILSAHQVEQALEDEKEHALTVRDAAAGQREVRLASRKPDEPTGYAAALSGIHWHFPPPPSELVHPGVGEQVAIAGSSVWRTVRALTSRHSGLGVNDLAGPVGIGRTYYRFLELDWRLVLWFSVILNINLAILNMLPLPVLDGGHITLALIEWIRRRPVPVRLLEPVYTGCALVLFAFMGYKLLQESWLMGTRTDSLDEPQGAAPAEPRFLAPGAAPTPAPVAPGPAAPTP